MEKECAEIVEVAEGPSVCAPPEEQPAEHHAAAVRQESAYGIKVWVQKPYDDVLKSVRSELHRQGLDRIGELDVRDYLEGKLGVDLPHYRILGAFSPELGYRALRLDRDLGLLMPFNLVIYEQTGGTVLEAIDPIAHLAIADSRDLEDLAREVKEKLQNVIDHVAAGLA